MSKHRPVSAVRVPLVVVGALVVLLAGCAPAPPTVPDGRYHVTIRVLGTMDPSVRSVFDTAAARLERVVTAGIPTVTPAPSFTGCLGVGPTGTIDGLVIDVQVTPIDGVGNILGSAGPCQVGPDGLPRAGLMKFDSDDVANLMTDGRFLQVVTHEMTHVLGLGTAWKAGQLTGTGTDDPRFTGANAATEWHALGGTGDVPVEATGGAGTAGSHWRESTFGNELMTGWLNSGSNPLSRMTIASFADLGYQVDRSQADPYSLPPALLVPMLRAAGAATEVGTVIPVTPTGQL